MCLRSLSVCVFLLLLAGCERETRRYAELPSANITERPFQRGSLEPGPPTGPDTPYLSLAEHGRYGYERNAFLLDQGKQLYAQFNCSGCHSQGGGGMGPPLLDSAWIYGSGSANVIETITHGRPNGMPAFGRKIGQQQIWILAAYVRSMSGLVTQDAAPGRSDQMQAKPPENQMTPEPRKP